MGKRGLSDTFTIVVYRNRMTGVEDFDFESISPTYREKEAWQKSEDARRFDGGLWDREYERLRAVMVRVKEVKSTADYR